MSSTCARTRWRSGAVRRDLGKARASGPYEDVKEYLVQKPVAAVGALWIVCYPMVFLLYGDLLLSATTLASMTVWFLGFLMAIITAMLGIALGVGLVFELLLQRSWAHGH